MKILSGASWSNCAIHSKDIRISFAIILDEKHFHTELQLNTARDFKHSLKDHRNRVGFFFFHLQVSELFVLLTTWCSRFVGGQSTACHQDVIQSHKAGEEGKQRR